MAILYTCHSDNPISNGGLALSHFYDKRGLPVYEVPNASKPGTMRDTTLRDAKKLDLVPSVTTIIGILDKPFVQHWITQQFLRVMIDKPWDSSKEALSDWFYRCQNIVEDKKGQKEGREIHKLMEDWINTGDVRDSRIANAVELLESNLDHEFTLYMECITEKSFSHILGFGGCVDMHHEDGKYIVDFKTKNKLELVEKDLIYDEHLMQLAAYRKGLDIPDAECYNLFISTADPTKVLLVKHKEEDLERAWKMFESLLTFWKLKNNV